MKTIYRWLFPLVILVGFSVGGWWASAIVSLSHDSDPAVPNFHSRLAPWDEIGVGGLFLLVGISGGVLTLLRPKRGFVAWILFSGATLILLLLGDQLLSR